MFLDSHGGGIVASCSCTRTISKHTDTPGIPVRSARDGRIAMTRTRLLSRHESYYEYTLRQKLTAGKRVEDDVRCVVFRFFNKAGNFCIEGFCKRQQIKSLAIMAEVRTSLVFFWVIHLENRVLASTT